MKSSVCVALAMVFAAGPAVAQCVSEPVHFAWTTPQNLPITDQDAQRWPTDATIRVAYSGVWCPDADGVRFEKFDNNNPDMPGVPVAAQIRTTSPAALVENLSQPLTVIEVDPIDELEPREDYRVVLSPPAWTLPTFEHYTLELRTRVGPADPFPDFEGILAVETDGGRCDDPSFFEAYSDAIPACLISSRLRLDVVFQPIDRGDINYVVYRTSSTPLDGEGQEILAEADRTLLPLAIKGAERDTLGTGLAQQRVRIFVLYAPLPRRDCFAVRALDEWGRLRGDLEAEACIDLVELAPCPDGCEGDQCMFGFPPPNPFETNEPIPGQVCPNIGLNGAPADREVPPIPMGAGGGGGEGGAGGAGGETDGGAGGAQADGGVGGEGGGSSEDDGGGGGCAAVDGHTPWLALWVLPLIAIRRRRSALQ